MLPSISGMIQKLAQPLHQNDLWSQRDICVHPAITFLTWWDQNRNDAFYSGLIVTEIFSYMTQTMTLGLSQPQTFRWWSLIKTWWSSGEAAGMPGEIKLMPWICLTCSKEKQGQDGARLWHPSVISDDISQHLTLDRERWLSCVCMEESNHYPCSKCFVLTKELLLTRSSKMFWYRAERDRYASISFVMNIWLNELKRSGVRQINKGRRYKMDWLKAGAKSEPFHSLECWSFSKIFCIEEVLCPCWVRMNDSGQNVTSHYPINCNRS